MEVNGGDVQGLAWGGKGMNVVLKKNNDGESGGREEKVVLLVGRQGQR
jgi:hypothetical protein